MEKVKTIPVSDRDHDGVVAIKNFEVHSREVRLSAALYLAYLKCLDGSSMGLVPVLGIIDSISDHEGGLTVWWTIPDPPQYYKDQFQQAWLDVGEDAGNVEHEYFNTFNPF